MHPEKVRKFVRVLIENSEGNLLALEESRKASKWNLPGGKVDFGEDFEQAAIREVFEETGLLVDDLILLTENIFVIEGQQWKGRYYYANSVKGQPCVREPSKCSEMRFLGSNEIWSVPSHSELFAEILESIWMTKKTDPVSKA